MSANHSCGCSTVVCQCESKASCFGAVVSGATLGATLLGALFGPIGLIAGALIGGAMGSGSDDCK